MLLEDLGGQECLARLGRAGIGRVAVSTGALPAIYTVFYAVRDTDLVLRVPPDCRLGRALRGSVVAFSVDEVDKVTGDGWSVLVQGLAEEVVDPWALGDLRALPLPSWSDRPANDTFIRISTENIKGIRLNRLRLPVAVG